LTVLGLAAGFASLAAFASDSGPSVDASTSGARDITGWITTADGTRRLSALEPGDVRDGATPDAVTLTIDAATKHQSIDGFGGAMTETSAWLLSRLPADVRDATLRSLFDPQTGAGLSYVRLPIGASDFALSAYSYDDVPTGETDPTLARFSIAHDDAIIIPMLHAVLEVNPRAKFLASTWSPPAWMKDSGTMYGGTLKREYFGVYAQYLVRAVQAYADRGIFFDTLTVQNEPGYSGVDYPTMKLSAADEATLIGEYVGPAFAAAGITAKILAYDHNWDDTTYATTVLSDPTASQYIAGSAWHCYYGNPDAQSVVHEAFPTKSLYFTECSGQGWTADYAATLEWNAQRIYGAVHHFARTAMLWNLAVDPSRGPHTGGCVDCRGVVTVDLATNTVTNNAEYDVLATAAKVAQPGAVRVESPWTVGDVTSLAFVNPDDSRALVVHNGSAQDRTVTVTGAGATFTVTLPAGSIAGYRW
jgi:glucosylceramidase